MKENKIEKLILDLSNRWDCSPQEAVDRLNSMNESEINKLINSMTKKFKNGGMIDCLRKGGSIKDCGCGSKINKDQEGGIVKGGNWKDYHTIINAPGDTLRFKQYFSGPTTMQTHPEGGVTYTKSSIDGVSHMYGGGYKPNLWERFVLGMSPVDKETEQNWQQLIKNHKNDPAVKDKTQKKQMGGMIEDEGPIAGRIPKSSMFDAAREFMPDVDRRFVRQAYRTAKRQGREAGNTGTYLRQDARDRVIEKFRNYADNIPVNMPQIPVLSTDIEIEDEPITINDNLFTNLDSSMPTVQKIDRFGGNFNSAFAAARRSGLGEFEWNGKRYTTDLAPQQPKIISQPTTGEMFNGRTTGGAVAPVPSTDAFYNAGSAVREWFKEQQPIRSAISAVWDPHPEPLPTHDRKAASQQMVRDYLNENSPRAKARLKK